MNIRELAWAAGLFDGEGTITTTDYSYKGREVLSAALRLTMTDEDAVRRFHQAVGLGKVEYIYPASFRAAGYKPQWRWRIQDFEGVQAVVAMLWYGLNRRRKGRAKDVLSRVAESRRQWPGRCRQGHYQNEDNTIYALENGRPRTRCRVCHRAYQHAYRRSK